MPAEPLYAALPAEVLLAIFALVPADQRPGLARVCSAFRAALRSPQLWARLDLRAASGVARRVDDATLRAFAEHFAQRAGGRLAALDLSGRRNVTTAVLLAVVAANSGVELTLCHPPPFTLGFDAVTQLLRDAGPNLGALRVNVNCMSSEQACAVLRRKGAELACVSAVRHLLVRFDRRPDADAITALLDAVASCTGGAPELVLSGTDLSSGGAFDALVDRTLAHRLPCLSLHACTLPQDGGAALESLLRDGTSLRELHLQESRPLFDAGHAACPLARGLAANTGLRVLSLRGCQVWDLGERQKRRRADATLALLAALVVHPSLCTLDLGDNAMWHIPVFNRNATTEAADEAAGAALGALLRAPALARRADPAVCGAGRAHQGARAQLRGFGDVSAGVRGPDAHRARSGGGAQYEPA